jgi:dipeptidyl aminopeptidase/acylaminoacyl peptidase
MIEQFQVISGDHRVSAVFTVPDAPGRFPCVLLSHGLVSSKESSKYVYLSQRFCGAGIAACRFDYHGCGESGGDISETTLTIRMHDLGSVLEHLLRYPSVDRTKIGILGSSFGGATALVEAARNPDVRCVALWATPYMLSGKKDESIDGILFKPLIYEDFSRYDLLADAKRVSRGLVIHGELDGVVPPFEGKAIYDNLKRPKKFELIEGGDHTFTAPSHRERAARLSVAWFAQHLR